jgi:hypothetical protein
MYVVIGSLDKWKGKDFKDGAGNPITNADELRQLYKLKELDARLDVIFCC